MPCLMLSKNEDPTEKELWRDTKGFAEIPDGLLPQEIYSQDLKDERQGILVIRNNEIREDGMGMAAAFTLDPLYIHYFLLYAAINEIDQETVVGSKETAMSGGATGRTEFCLGNKLRLKSREHRFPVQFIKIYLALKKILSYHSHVHKCRQVFR